VPLEALPIIRERFPQTLYWNPEAVTNAEGRVQVTICPAAEHDHPGPEADTKVNPSGRVSETVTLAATKGPLLRGRTVNVAF
jgi:hypothetical protein